MTPRILEDLGGVVQRSTRSVGRGVAAVLPEGPCEWLLTCLGIGFFVLIGEHGARTEAERERELQALRIKVEALESAAALRSSETSTSR